MSEQYLQAIHDKFDFTNQQKWMLTVLATMGATFCFPYYGHSDKIRSNCIATLAKQGKMGHFQGLQNSLKLMDIAGAFLLLSPILISSTRATVGSTNKRNITMLFSVLISVVTLFIASIFARVHCPKESDDDSCSFKSLDLLECPSKMAIVSSTSVLLLGVGYAFLGDKKAPV